MNDGQEAVRSESPKEQALLALPVVDELAAHGPGHYIGSFSQIVNLQRRPVLTEAVRKNSVGALQASEIDDFVSDGLDASDTLDGYRIGAVVLYLSLDDTKSSRIVDLNCVCKISELRKSGGSDCNFGAASESILKVRLSYLMLRVIR